MNEDLLYHYNSIKCDESKINTFIKYNVLEQLKRADNYFYKKEDFDLACESGSLEVAQWFYSNKQESNHFIYVILYHICKDSHFETIKWLFTICDTTHIFTRLLTNGSFEFVQWLYIIGRFDINDPCDDIFINSCIFGQFKKAKWLYELKSKLGSPLNIHQERFLNNTIFQDACINGHFEVVKWLYELSLQLNLPININIPANIMQLSYPMETEIQKNSVCIGFYIISDIFSSSCVKGSLEMIQWLYYLKKESGNIPDIHFDNEKIFRDACVSKKLDIAQWVYYLSLELNSPINIHIFNDHSFRYSCFHGNLEMTQWLYSLGGVNIHANNDEVFRNSPPEILEWLNTLTQ